MYKLIVKEVAYQMLAEAYQWYEAQSPGLGERLLGEVDDCFKKSPTIRTTILLTVKITGAY